MGSDKAHRSGIKDRVEGGASENNRRGNSSARIGTAEPPRRRFDAALLRALTDMQQPQAEDAARLVRSMRDGSRY